LFWHLLYLSSHFQLDHTEDTFNYSMAIQSPIISYSSWSTTCNSRPAIIWAFSLSPSVLELSQFNCSFENIMENWAFAPKEQMFHVPLCFQSSHFSDASKYCLYQEKGKHFQCVNGSALKSFTKVQTRMRRFLYEPFDHDLHWLASITGYSSLEYHCTFSACNWLLRETWKSDFRKAVIIILITGKNNGMIFFDLFFGEFMFPLNKLFFFWLRCPLTRL